MDCFQFTQIRWFIHSNLSVSPSSNCTVITYNHLLPLLLLYNIWPQTLVSNVRSRNSVLAPGTLNMTLVERIWWVIWTNIRLISVSISLLCPLSLTVTWVTREWQVRIDKMNTSPAGDRGQWSDDQRQCLTSLTLDTSGVLTILIMSSKHVFPPQRVHISTLVIPFMPSFSVTDARLQTQLASFLCKI